MKTLTKLLVVFISILLMASMAFARGTCESKAVAKKLVGEAEASFMKRCEADAKAANAQADSEAIAKEKNMAGVAKDNLLKILFSRHKI
ncbi:MAG: hypothetical protein ABFD76_07915 [Smithella sp.]